MKEKMVVSVNTPISFVGEEIFITARLVSNKLSGRRIKFYSKDGGVFVPSVSLTNNDGIAITKFREGNRVGLCEVVAELVV